MLRLPNPATLKNKQPPESDVYLYNITFRVRGQILLWKGVLLFMKKKVIEVGFPVGHEVLELGASMEESKIKEIDFYRQQLHNTIDSISRLDVLIYLNRLIERIAKEGR